MDRSETKPASRFPSHSSKFILIVKVNSLFNSRSPGRKCSYQLRPVKVKPWSAARSKQYRLWCFCCCCCCWRKKLHEHKRHDERRWKQLVIANIALTSCSVFMYFILHTSMSTLLHEIECWSHVKVTSNICNLVCAVCAVCVCLFVLFCVSFFSFMSGNIGFSWCL